MPCDSILYFKQKIVSPSASSAVITKCRLALCICMLELSQDRIRSNVGLRLKNKEFIQTFEKLNELN